MLEKTIQYLKKNHIKLSQDEIRELFKDKIKNQDKIMKSQMALVMNLAQRYHHFNKKKMLDEVISDCLEGLMKAMQYYNPIEYPNVDFTAYAHTSIKQAMMLHKTDNEVIRPSIKARRGQLAEDETYVTTTKFEDMVNLDGEGTNFLEIYQKAEDNNLVEDLDRYNKLCTVIKETFKDKPRYADIIIANFGLCGMSDKLTQEEIGEMFGVTKQAVNQIKLFALKKLKNNKDFITYLKETYYE
jgi:RNA polymerase sigma factor (sigma-70 family)